MSLFDIKELHRITKRQTKIINTLKQKIRELVAEDPHITIETLKQKLKEKNPEEVDLCISIPAYAVGAGIGIIFCSLFGHKSILVFGLGCYITYKIMQN